MVTFSNDCLTDSFFTLQYLPSINDLRFIVKENENRIVQIDQLVDKSRCWHHVAIIRKGYNYFLIVDGIKSPEYNAERLFTFPQTNVLTLSNNFVPDRMLEIITDLKALLMNLKFSIML